MTTGYSHAHSSLDAQQAATAPRLNVWIGWSRLSIEVFETQSGWFAGAYKPEKACAIGTAVDAPTRMEAIVGAVTEAIGSRQGTARRRTSRQARPRTPVSRWT